MRTAKYVLITLFGIYLISVTYYGTTTFALQSGLNSGRVDWVRFALTANPFIVNSRDDYDETPLHRAIESSYHRVVRVLLASGADPNADSQSKGTCLLLAMDYSHTGIINALLESGADVNRATKVSILGIGETPLHCVAGKGNLDLAEMLLKLGANPNAQNSRGNTPLHTAAMMSVTDVAKRERIVELLLKHGADPTISNENALIPFDFVEKPIKHVERGRLPQLLFDALPATGREKVIRRTRVEDLQ